MLSFAPISALPLSALPELVVALFASGTLTAADSLDYRIYAATREFISQPADTPSNQPFEGTLESLPRVDRTIISGGNAFGGLVNTWGSMKLNNQDGAYDYLVRSYAVDGQTLTFKVGDPTSTYASFFAVATLLGKTMHVSDETVEIALSDNSYRLDVPAQPNVYSGTGDLTGTADLANKRKPRAFGPAKNITPATLIPQELVYQVNDGPVQAISAVYDQGYPLDGPTADFATAALLRAATVTDGWFATCIAEGMFKLGAPGSQITADVLGDKTGGVYVNTRGTIIRRLLGATDIGDPAELDTVSFDNFEADQPGQVEFYIDPNSTDTVAQVIDKLIKPVMGWAGFDIRNAKFQIGVLKAPAGTPIGSYDEVDILNIVPEPLPDSLDPPPYRQRVSYDHNWTQITNPIGAVVENDPDRAAWLGSPYKVASTPDSAATPIRAAHKNAQDPDVIVSYFALEADATAEATRQLTLKTSGYTLDRVTLDLSNNAFTLDIGQTMSVTYPRRGFSAGKLGRLVAVSDDPDDNSVEGWVFG